MFKYHATSEVTTAYVMTSGQYAPLLCVSCCGIISHEDRGYAKRQIHCWYCHGELHHPQCSVLAPRLGAHACAECAGYD